METMGFLLFRLDPLFNSHVEEIAKDIRTCKSPNFCVGYAEAVHGIYDIVVRVDSEVDNNKDIKAILMESSEHIKQFVGDRYGNSENKYVIYNPLSVPIMRSYDNK